MPPGTLCGGSDPSPEPPGVNTRPRVWLNSTYSLLPSGYVIFNERVLPGSVFENVVVP